MSIPPLTRLALYFVDRLLSVGIPTGWERCIPWQHILYWSLAITCDSHPIFWFSVNTASERNHGFLQGWDHERVALRIPGKDDRVICVLPGDSNSHLRKVQEVVKVMEQELGLSEGWLWQKHCKVGNPILELFTLCWIYDTATLALIKKFLLCLT